MMRLACTPLLLRCIMSRVAVAVVLAFPSSVRATIEVAFVAGPTVPFTVGFDASPQSFALRDMNGDGAADVVAIEQVTGSVAVLLNHGDGSFGPPQSIALEVFPTALAVADLNGDTHPDAAVVDDDGGVSLIFGDAAGTMRVSEQIDPGIELIGVVAADLDEDGKVDLALLEVCDEIVLQQNLGGGTFDCFDEEFLETGSVDPIGIASGDVDGDAHADLLVLNRVGENVSLLRGNGDGTFLPPVQYAIGSGPRAFAVGRVNNDDRDDVVVVDAGFFGDNVTVLLGDAQLGLRPTDKSMAAANASAVALGDFDGDRCLDFISPSLEELTPALGLGNCTGTFTPSVASPMLGFGRAVQTGDLDGDGRVDFSVLDEDGELFSSALNRTPGRCPGDCDASGSVAVNELVAGVNILLDRSELSQCAVLDANNDGRITVDELVRAVNNLLRGCDAV